MERFAMVYDYPYGSGYLSSYTDEPAKEIFQTQNFERIIRAEREMRPFHVACPVTHKNICFCN